MSQSIELILTRSSDVNLGLSNRAAVARTKRADLFLSIHLNGWHSPNVQGTECYHHTSATPQSQHFARLVQNEAQKVTGLRDRGVKACRLGVLNPMRHNKATASCLLEVSFLTNPTEEARLNDPTYIIQLGQAVSLACQSYFNNKYKDIFEPENKNNFEEASLFQTFSATEEELDGGISLSSIGDYNATPSFQAKSASKRAPSHRAASSLRDIKGIGPARVKALAKMGITTPEDLSSMSISMLIKCSEQLRVDAKVIENWIAQTRK